MITDEMLAQAADAYVQIMVENIPELPEYRHSFSARFERRIRRIIRRGSHPVLYRTMRAAGYAVAVLVISFLTLMAVNPSARAAVMDWIRDIYASYYSHSYYGAEDDVDIQNIECEIDYVPANYVQIHISETEYNTTYYFSNSMQEVLYITYSKRPRNIEYFSEMDEYKESTVTINDNVGYLLIPANQANATILQLVDNDTGIFIIISGYVDSSELTKIAENIKIKY